MTRQILILGATSGIARGIAVALAKKKNNLYLCGRDIIELEKIAADLKIRYEINIKTKKFDCEDLDSHVNFFNNIMSDIKNNKTNINGVIFAIGSMGNDAQQVLTTNLTGAVSILELWADYFAEKKQGFIVGISSVAGDRGRQNNYIYAAAKSGFSTYLQGLRARLYKKNIRVITVKPGFIDTAMTFGLPGMFLVADPVRIGEKIVESIESHKDIIYVPWFWKYIMLIIKSIPERIFKTMAL